MTYQPLLGYLMSNTSFIGQKLRRINRKVDRSPVYT